MGEHWTEMLAAAELSSLAARVAPSNEHGMLSRMTGCGAEEDAGLAWQEKAKFGRSAQRGVGCVC